MKPTLRYERKDNRISFYADSILIITGFIKDANIFGIHIVTWLVIHYHLSGSEALEIYDNSEVRTVIQEIQDAHFKDSKLHSREDFSE